LFRLESLIEKKPSLLGIVVATIVGTLAIPVILPHLFHGYHVYHILLHVTGICAAVFITILAIMAYYRLKTKRLLLTTIAFGIFIAAESIVLIDATWPQLYDLNQVSLLELGHMLTITSLAVLAAGVFRND
jgi:ABC-type cobalamin transport system permease subunit